VAMKKNWIRIFCLGLVLLIHALPQVTFAKDVVRLYFFYSEESGGQKVKEEFIKPLSEKFPMEIQSFSLNKLDNYDLLDKFEKELKQEGNDLPVVIIGNKILGGEAKIRKDLEGLVKSYAEKGGIAWPSLQVTKTEQWIPHAPTEEEKRSQKIIYGAFFYTHGCLHCEGVKAKLGEWASKLPDLRIGTFDMTKEENKRIGEALFEIYRIPESQRGDIVKLYIGEDYLSGDDFRHEDFEKLVSKYQGKVAPPPWEKVTQEALMKGEEKIIDRFKKFSLWGVLLAGLIDGLNPCAFATIVFLVSYLSFLGKQNKEILTYGIIFTLGVFIAYIIAGVGLMAGLRQLSGFPMITKGIYLVIGMFAFILGIISFYDYLQFRRGHMEKMKLQLPMFLKKKIHGIIRKQTRSPKAGIIATFTLGFVIAAAEVVCTGQVYLPTIGYIMSIPELRVHAFLNLILYNIMFIIPLVGVFIAAFFGVTSERMALATKKRTGTVKLLTALLFIGLGVFLFIFR
jgi:cytochrome c biogenesis protein CcdA/thiol-disulfide isomerase/thioredoxin